MYPSEASAREKTGSGSQYICVEDGAVIGAFAPTNIPAQSLFEKNGFTYAGDADLELGIGDIDAFRLYELNL